MTALKGTSTIGVSGSLLETMMDAESDAPSEVGAYTTNASALWPEIGCCPFVCRNMFGTHQL